MAAERELLNKRAGSSPAQLWVLFSVEVSFRVASNCCSRSHTLLCTVRFAKMPPVSSQQVSFANMTLLLRNLQEMRMPDAFERAVAHMAAAVEQFAGQMRSGSKTMCGNVPFACRSALLHEHGQVVATETFAVTLKPDSEFPTGKPSYTPEITGG